MNFIVLCGLALPIVTAQQLPEKQRTSLHQEIVISASAESIYNTLLSSKQFSSFTGMEAKIENKDGGALKMFGGLVTGRNVELIPDKRIVQAWRPESWKPGVYSIVSFTLKPEGSKTLVVLDHTGFPAGTYAGLYDGWKLHYWDPIMKFLK